MRRWSRYGRKRWKSPWIEYCVGSFVLVDLWSIYTSSSSSSSPSLSVVDDVPSESLPDCPEVSENFCEYIFMKNYFETYQFLPQERIVASICCLRQILLLGFSIL